MPVNPTPFSFISQANYIERKSSGLDGRCNSVGNETDEVRLKTRPMAKTDVDETPPKKLILKHCEAS